MLASDSAGRFVTYRYECALQRDQRGARWRVLILTATAPMDLASRPWRPGPLPQCGSRRGHRLMLGVDPALIACLWRGVRCGRRIRSIAAHQPGRRLSQQLACRPSAWASQSVDAVAVTWPDGNSVFRRAGRSTRAQGRDGSAGIDIDGGVYGAGTVLGFESFV